jgi:hypothetical protein
MIGTIIGFTAPVYFNRLMTFLEEGNPDTFLGIRLAFMMIGVGIIRYFFGEFTGYRQHMIG